MSKQLKYGLSFAELCDRAQIVTLKVIASKERNEAFEKELDDIYHDIQIHLDEIPMTAEMLRGFTVLNLVNQFIFSNETFVRDVDDNGGVEDSVLLSKLQESHRANSLRASAKKHIQIQRGSRVDLKLNYGKSSNFWNITF